MRAWQWSAVPLGIGLLLCIVAYPFTHYADIDVDVDQPVAAAKGTTSRVFKGWRNGFLPIHEIKRLNNYEINGTPIKLSSGPNPNARPNWLVVLLLIAFTALLCGLILGHRPSTFSARRKLLLEACGGVCTARIGWGRNCQATNRWFLLEARHFGRHCQSGRPVPTVGVGVGTIGSSRRRQPRGQLTKHLRLITTFLMESGFTMNTEERIKGHPERNDVAGIEAHDLEMIAAQKKARETLLEFTTAVQARENDKRYLLEAVIMEGQDTEHVWLEPVKWNDPGLAGILAVDPITIRKHKKGDEITPKPEEVTDWVILSRDGSKKGGFTIDVIKERRAEAKKSGQGRGDSR